MKGKLMLENGRWIVLGQNGSQYPLSGEDCQALSEYGHDDALIGSSVKFKIEQGEAVIQKAKLKL